MSLNNNVIAVNEAELNHLMTDIMDYSSRVRQIFDRIDDLVNESKTYYDSDSATILRNKFNLLKQDFKITVNNLMSYNSDLARLKNKYVNSMSTISGNINRKATTIRDNKTW